MSWADRTYADAYFANRLNTDAWDNATEANQDKALAQATAAFERLSYRGEKTSSTQTYQFPRGRDTEIPSDCKDAVCEEALNLLDGADIQFEYENLFMRSEGFANVRSSHDTGQLREHIAAGITSITAWRLILPYLRDTREIRVERAS